MTVPDPPLAESDARVSRRLSPSVAALGCVSMLTAISSSMIYGLPPVFLVKVLGASMASVGLIEGMAEAANSFIKVLSGAVSDRLGRRSYPVAAPITASDESAVLWMRSRQGRGEA